MENNPMNVFYLYVVSSVFQVCGQCHWFRYHLYKFNGEGKKKKKIMPVRIQSEMIETR